MCLECTDTGCGISEEDQSRLFQPYIQVGSGIQFKAGGTGLGLVIANDIIERHGGSVSVKSTLGEGTTFAFDLWCDLSSPSSMPFYTPVPSPHPASRLFSVMSEERERGELDRSHMREERVSEVTVEMSGYSMKTLAKSSPAPQVVIPTMADTRSAIVAPQADLCGRRVLLVDDSVPNIKLLRRLLVSVGLEVEVAENGQIALDVVRAHEEGDKQLPDLVLMDLQMPVMNGTEATRRLRELGYTFPIIAVSGNVLLEDRTEFMGVGGSSFLSKPITKAILVKAMRSFIQRSPIPRDVT
jgi:two-component system capsular synthesis sensor histidine kinase RcsC